MHIIRQLRRAKFDRKTKKYLKKHGVHIPKLVKGYGYSLHTAKLWALNAEIQIQAHKRGVKPILVAIERFAECTYALRTRALQATFTRRQNFS